MGVLNVTPDSYSDGGRYFDRARAIEQAHELVAQGAAILDIGGESTRPYAREVSQDEELERVIPVIRTLAERFPVPISIDTTKATVAEAAAEQAAAMRPDPGPATISQPCSAQPVAAAHVVVTGP